VVEAQGLNKKYVKKPPFKEFDLPLNYTPRFPFTDNIFEPGQACPPFSMLIL